MSRLRARDQREKSHEARPAAVPAPADAFLAAIRDAPDDDVPRLQYADWLDEHGDPRGEFIRVQCALNRLDEDDDRRPALEEREQTLLREHRVAWLGSLPELTADTQLRFRRGFVEQVSIGVRKFMDNGETLFAAAPVRRLKLLRLTQSTIGAAEVAACPLLARVRELDLNGSHLGDVKLPGLLASPHLHNLTALYLNECDAGPATLRALAAAALAGLKTLELGGNMLRPALPQLVGAEPRFRLTALDLSTNELDETAARGLAAWPGLASLKRLNLANNLLRVAGTEALAASPHLAGLTHLNLHGCLTGAAGVRALTAAGVLGELETLDLGGNNLGINAAKAVAAVRHWERLRELRLGSNQLTADAVALLADWPGLARLTRLQLSHNEIRDRGVTVLTASPYLEGLRHLDLAACFFGDAGARALASCAHLKQLRTLDLASNGIGDAGAKALLHAPFLDRLRWLNLSFNRIGPRQQKALESRLGPRAVFWPEWGGPFGERR